MSRVLLSDSLRSALQIAAARALARRDALRIDDLLAALLEGSIGPRIAPAIAPIQDWPLPTTDTTQAGSLCVHMSATLIPFERSAEQIFQSGAEAVIIGDYEPRHLAIAIGNVALTTRAPFARYGLDPQAWRRALSRNP